MDSWDKFDELELPPKEAFYSNLNMNNISNKDYSHTQNVRKGFGMKNVGEYHDLYLKTDIILLSNVFEAFRATCLKHYSHDPTHFYTSPGWMSLIPKETAAFNLYGCVMSQPIPNGGFNWLDPSEFTPDRVDSHANWDS